MRRLAHWPRSVWPYTCIRLRAVGDFSPLVTLRRSENLWKTFEMSPVWKCIALLVCVVVASVSAKSTAMCTAKCSAGYHCEMKTVQCIRAPCPQQPTCVQNACPEVYCALYCDNYVYDANNCRTCSCQTTGVTCGTTVCAPGQVCQQVQCFAAPCYPVCSDPPA